MRQVLGIIIEAHDGKYDVVFLMSDGTSIERTFTDDEIERDLTAALN